MFKNILPTMILAAATASPLAAITLADLSPTALSGSGKTLEMTFTGGDSAVPLTGTWTLTFEKAPANGATVRNFPGHAAASTTTWAYDGAPFPESHGYAFTDTAAFGNQGGSLTLWISEGGARFYLTINGENNFGDVTIGSGKAPEIAIQQPAGSNLADGKATRSFGTAKVGTKSATKTFTIRNSGNAKLTGLAIRKSGANKSDFIVTEPGKTSLAAGAKTTFTITFKPGAKGTRKAAIAIASNDADENPFNISLSGEGAAK